MARRSRLLAALLVGALALGARAQDDAEDAPEEGAFFEEGAAAEASAHLVISKARSNGPGLAWPGIPWVCACALR